MGLIHTDHLLQYVEKLKKPLLAVSSDNITHSFDSISSAVYWLRDIGKTTCKDTDNICTNIKRSIKRNGKSYGFN